MHTLIQSGGGTGPMRPGDQLGSMVLIVAGDILKDKRDYKTLLLGEFFYT